MRFRDAVGIVAGTQLPASGTVAGSPIDASNLVRGTVQGVVTGAPTGSLKLQASNDPGTPTNWNDIASATAALAGTAGPFLVPVSEMAFKWVRVAYTATSGTGAIASCNFVGIGWP